MVSLCRIDSYKQVMTGATALRRLVLAGFLAAHALVCSACLEAGSGSADQADAGCDYCHGYPPDTGAHVAHVQGQDIGKKIGCENCHPVPISWFVDNHPDAHVDVAFPDGGLARARGAEPEWNGVSCTGVYCHGATMTAGSDPEPDWYSGKPRNCMSCHGAPDPAPHPDSFDCEGCHAASYKDNGRLDPVFHIDGVVELN